MQLLRRLNMPKPLQQITNALYVGAIEVGGQCVKLCATHIRTELAEHGCNDFHATYHVDVAQQVERGQLGRGYLHGTGDRLELVNRLAKRLDALAEVKCQPRTSCSDLAQLPIGDDLEFHHRLVRGPMQLRSLEQGHVVRPAPHERIDVPGGRWCPPGVELGWYRHVEPVARAQE